MPLAVQYGMPTNEFWHGDMRLLEVYQKAYLRNVSYMAWQNGFYNFMAHDLALNNAFLEKGKPKANYPNWTDPMEKYEKPKVTNENVEESFRNEHIAQNAWLHDILKK